MDQHPLKPLLHYSLSIVFQQDVLNFNKHRKNTARVFAQKNPQLQTIRLERVTSKSEVLKIVKKLKFIKTAKLSGSSHLTNQFLKPSRMHVLVKNMRTVESLFIQESLSDKLPVSLSIWLKNAKKIKDVTWLSVQEANRQELKLVEKKIRKLFLWINRLKLKSLHINATHLPGKNSSPFMFQKYPSSLEEFSLSCVMWEFYIHSATTIPLIPNNSLSNLTQLKTLHFGIDDSKGILVALLNSFSDLAQLETLDLTFEDNTTCAIQYLLPFFSTLRKENNLQRLRLYFKSSPENLEPIFAAIDVESLTEFEFVGSLNSKLQSTQLSTFLSSLDKLKSLKLVIPDRFDLKNSDLDLLKLPADLWVALTKILKKPVPLQALTVDISSQNSVKFEQILRFFKDSAPSLKLLRLNLETYYPSKSDFNKIIELPKDLKQIEILDLSSISIPGDQSFKDIVDWCETLKGLRSLSLGKIEAIQSNDSFANLVEKVIKKRGIEYFSCTAAERFKMSFDKANKDMPYIDLKAVKQKNPALEFYPRFIIMHPKRTIQFRVMNYENWDRNPKLKHL